MNANVQESGLFSDGLFFFFATQLKPERTTKLTPSQALLKAANYCAYQERSHKEVLEKLGEWGLWGLDAQEILLTLIEQNYVNEERYAIAFAGGKFRVKQWGRIKIRQALKLQQISEYCMNKALSQFSEEEYLETLSNLVEKKWEETKDPNPYSRKSKVARFVTGKGFEQDLVWEELKKR